MPSCQKCQCQFPNWIKVDGKSRCVKNRKYCLSCSPFGMHNTRNLNQEEKEDKRLNQEEKEDKLCPRCQVTKPLSEFYSRRNKTEPSPYCRPCTNEQTVVRQQSLKRRAVEYKGGKCQKCGYATYIGALEFHHLDPLEKDPVVSKKKTVSFDTIKAELDKCILLCANCHREAHHEWRRKGVLQCKS